MKKISKIKSSLPTGAYESQYGLLYKYEYVFEDGTILVANHKKQQPLGNGTLAEYEIKGSNDSGSWGSVSKPQEEQTFNKPKGANASFALSYAKDWCLGIHNAGDIRTTADVLAVAQKFNEWLNDN